jgi:anhydro-N-acetylmuramic acid kinase
MWSIDRKTGKGKGAMQGDFWRVLGTMSGPSLKGIDAAVLITDGERIAAFGETAHRPYRPEEQAVLRAAYETLPGDPQAEAAAEVVETAHAELLARFAPVDLLGFHGLTLLHEPGGRGTHQAGSGALLAEALGWPVVWDFRSADMRLGGQGAPLAAFYHHVLLRRIGETGPAAVLDLGGLASLTWVDCAEDAPELACLAFNCGPGMVALDDLIRTCQGQDCDIDGALAAQGQVNVARLSAFADHPFFARIPPKALDRTGPMPDVSGLSVVDAMATMTDAVATGVALAFAHLPARPARLWVTGGGRRNATLMAMIAARCPCPVAPIDKAGIDGATTEAQAIAYLAARVARGLPTTAPGTTGVGAAVGGGTLSRPEGRNRIGV